MDFKALQMEIATLRFEKSAVTKYQGGNIKYFHLEPNAFYIQKVFSTKHIKGGNNPYSLVQFIGFGSSPTNTSKGPYPRAIDIKTDQFYWFRTWDINLNKMVIFKAGKLNNVLGIGFGCEDMIRVSYAGLIGVTEITITATPIESIPEVKINVDRVPAASSAEGKQEQRDKELDFWRRLQEQNDARQPKSDTFPMEMIILKCNELHTSILQEKYKGITSKKYNGVVGLSIPFENIYSTGQLRSLITDFGLDWNNDVILQRMEKTNG
jgi:hypothetical protein